MSPTKILRLNNHGVLLLKQKKMDEAVRSFKRAKKYLSHPVAGITARNASTQPCKPMISWTDLSDTWTRRDFIVSPHNTFDIYECAFTFDDNFDPHANSVILSAVVQYNLALAHHLLALVAIEYSTRHMQEALRCYRQGVKVIRYSPPFPGADQLYLVTMAYLNNMGHIFSHFCQTEQSMNCRERIDVLLGFGTPSFLSEDDTEFFDVGIIQTQGNFRMAAAAA
eukprot:scaffold84_cov163-Amphora_coffeaeformis.AAC.13